MDFGIKRLSRYTPMQTFSSQQYGISTVLIVLQVQGSVNCIQGDKVVSYFIHEHCCGTSKPVVSTPVISLFLEMQGKEDNNDDVK